MRCCPYCMSKLTEDEKLRECPVCGREGCSECLPKDSTIPCKDCREEDEDEDDDAA